MKLKLTIKLYMLVCFAAVGGFGQVGDRATGINGDELLVNFDSNAETFADATVPPLLGPDLEAEQVLRDMEIILTPLAVAAVDASWNYNTDITPENAAIMNEASANFSSTYNEQWNAHIKAFDYSTVNIPYLRRQFELQQSIGTAILVEPDYTNLNNLINSMTEKLNNRVCPFVNQACDLATDGLTIDDLEVEMGVNKNYDELLYYWQSWRDVSGKLMLGDYPSYVDLENLAATGNEFNDAGQMWVNPYTAADYTSDDFKAEIEGLWIQLEPFYKKLHAYVRFKLMENPEYSQHFNSDGLIPAHILGDMYAQSWANIYNLVAPYPDVPLIDLTPTLEAKITDVKEMFQIAEEFFVSIGMFNMTPDFWANSLYEQPPDKEVVCHASAWDFFSTEVDVTVEGRFRIKMCTNKNQEDFITIHHEMGHIEYDTAYGSGRPQKPLIYRDGANPGFHEAIGDTIALSVSTPAHLALIESQLNGAIAAKRLRAVKEANSKAASQQDLNFLMKQALDKVAFLPFAYIIDQWRWEVFAEEFQSDTYNTEWWNKRVNYQGLRPPVDRSDLDFDIGCKFHVPSSVPYIRYFVAVILQFQFHERLCEIAGNTEPIYNCDIYGNTAAGSALLNMLQNGASVPWQDQLGEFMNTTGQMDASSILAYFEPLMQYLDDEISSNNITVGWTNETLDWYLNDGASVSITDMDTNLTVYVQNEVDAIWNYYTDVTQTNLDAMNQATNAFSSMYNYYWEQVISPYDYTAITDPEVKRQYEMQQSIGTAILSDTDFAELNDHINLMTDKLNNKVCPFSEQNCVLASEGLTIDDLEVEMGVNKNYAELLYYWQSWRDVSGKLMLDDYPPYVDLENKAGTLNNFNDAGQMWVNPYTGMDYTSDDFQADIEGLWTQLEPFYKNLHAYVRFKLMENPEYSQHFNLDGLIPAHILGDMYAQSWANIYDVVAPYPDVPLIDLTPTLEAKITDVKEMFQISEEFFASLGMYSMTQDFWDNSVYEQPPDKIVLCHASAMDFRSTEPNNTLDGRYRIKMCTNKNQEDFITIHHEMGHIEYFMAYSDGKPLIFRDGANPGFHEAIGDTIALSVSTPAHLALIESQLNGAAIKGLRSRRETNPKAASQQDLNFLMKQALDKVAFLPFAYIIDKWRWDVFAGKISSDSYNYEWWNKRLSYQGVRPPVQRSTSVDFDIGCKFHVPTSVPYIRYFVAVILQFQFHERLCDIAGNTEPIYNCDIYGNTDAGSALLNMLQNGASVPWQDQLGAFMNSDGKMDASSILAYFEPLMQYLDDEISSNNIPVGWDNSTLDSYFMASLTDLTDMDTNITVHAHDEVVATWDYFTNVTNENAKNLNSASLTFSSVYKSWWETVIVPSDPEHINDQYIARQYELQKCIGTSALNTTDLDVFNKHVNNMMKTHLDGKVCPYYNNKCDENKDGLSIQELENSMKDNKLYSELLWYWEKWRDHSARNMIEDFSGYVELTRMAAEANGIMANASEMWIAPYTGPNYSAADFRAEIDSLWNDLKEFYRMLHGYVRSRLRNFENKQYDKYFNSDNLIPAHILGNMYSENWDGIYDVVVPFRDVDLIELTPILIANVTDVKQMFTIAEEFYTSLGLYSMTPDFWDNSVFTNNASIKTICEPSAMDFRSTESQNSVDGQFRIKMCTNTTQDDLLRIVHEMGHIEYFMAYSTNNHPLIFRNGANPGFHEAIGETIGLSVSTQSRLEQIYMQLNGSLPMNARAKNYTSSEQQDLNFLMKQALNKIPMLPFAYIMDQWRWEAFDGAFDTAVYNTEWWRKSIEHQGIRPGISRTADYDLDIGSKYHLSANVPYISYFVGTILQFQFHERLCDIAGNTEPIYNCDIYGNTDAGSALLDMMQKGMSVQWQDQLAGFLGVPDGKMSALSILTYFEPLIQFLNDTIVSENIPLGWSADVVDDYINKGETISAIVPIIVGAVLVVLVCIVVVAFFIGQKKRKALEKKEMEMKKASGTTGKHNEALELDEKNDI